MKEVNCCRKKIRGKSKTEKGRKEKRHRAEWRGCGLCARAWHEKASLAARPSCGSCISHKSNLKQCSARTRFGTAKVQQELKVILQKQWRDLGNRQARALGKVLFHIDCERTKDTRGVNLAVIFASKLVWPYYDAVEIH